MYFGDGFHMGGMHGLWWLFWILLIGALVYAAWGRPSKLQRGSRETPHEVLRRRLANGEIDVQEYEQRKALLDRDAGKAS
ncbi:SHOCT domain-containing protein [Methylibium petroleiphilum]|nr:SHOCT domain-containing protein [Methylibium sp.]